MDEQRKSEVDWVKEAAESLRNHLDQFPTDGHSLAVETGWRLPYACEISGYVAGNERKPTHVEPYLRTYQTDLLTIGRDSVSGRWWPLVVVECKYGSVTTHDSLTYSTKAASHKSVHPYLRYGFLIGAHDNEGVPARLFVHGAHFDFSVAWQGEEATPKEWREWLEVLKSEVVAAQTLRSMLTSKKAGRQRYSTIHRSSIIKSMHTKS